MKNLKNIMKKLFRNVQITIKLIIIWLCFKKMFLKILKVPWKIMKVLFIIKKITIRLTLI